MESTLTIRLAVSGTLMRGFELNGNLIAAGASFARATTTAPHYRLWSIGDRHPAMVRVPRDGAPIATLGILGEPALCEGQREITEYGGWRAYLVSRGAA